MRKILPLALLASCAYHQHIERMNEIDNKFTQEMYSPCPTEPGYAGCFDLSKTTDVSTEQGMKSFFARMKLRYQYANNQEVALVCEAYPERCKTLEDIEFQTALNHNGFLKKAWLDAIKQENAQYKRDEAARTTAALQQFSESMKDTSTNCTSTPNGYGGYNTRCD